MTEMDGTHYLAELVKSLTGDRNSENYLGDFTVTAVVNGTEKVSSEIIECQLTIKHDSVDISIFWEECGYKGFIDMGLYGRTNSNYFTVKELSSNAFQITDNGNSNKTIFER